MKEFHFVLRSGKAVRIEYDSDLYGGVIDHAAFWGDTISPTGYQSFFSHFGESDLEKIAQELEDEYYTDEVKAQKEQANLFL
jgi:hypothetical protein